jgi:hypothetical protein
LRAALRTHRAQLTNHEVWGVSGSTPTSALPVTVRMM